MLKYNQSKTMLKLLHDGSMSTEVKVSAKYGDKSVSFFSSLDDYESNFISLTIEEWELVKEWVDKKINGKLQLNYPAQIKKQKEGTFLVTFRDIPEALTEGSTYEEALEMAEDALATAMDFYVTRPEPSQPEKDEILIELREG